MSAVILYITASGVEEARKLARSLVEERLAACTNIIPRVLSTYWWEGEICEDEEAVIIAKTTAEMADRAMAAVKERHSYQVPAILALDIAKGLPAYLEWLAAEVRP
ncbi:MAG: divalent-cation tolerance protein CutA [Bacillota bacterium]